MSKVSPSAGTQHTHTADPTTAPAPVPSDQIWMDNTNTQRRNDGLAVVSYEIFEIIFDKLEKEWFDLVCYFFPLFVVVCRGR